MAPEGPEIQGDELPPGVTLCNGQYTIDGYLNAGGFGVTYLARDSLGRRVVIKECFPSAMCFRSNRTVCVRSHGNAVEFDAVLELFEKEARALAALQHPFIVGVHQYFRDNGTAYMAMDFVEGKTLLEIIETEPERLTPETVKKLLAQLLQAVSYIHRHDILHRDISPDNILIDEDNLPVLIDFGAAREDASRVSRVLSKVLTVKDGYSPQEFYLAGSAQVAASDLYALAATFYHVLTGTAPTNSNTRMAAAARDSADPLPQLAAVDGYEPGFLAAINRCLSLFPKDRLHSAEAWQEVIDEGLRQKKMLQRAERDEAIDRVVARLVQDFFRDFRPVATEADVNNKPDAPPPKASPAPVAPPADADVDLVDEPFAEDAADETLEDSDGDAAGDATAPQPTPRRPDRPKLSPIERMRLKHEPPCPDEEPAAQPRSGRSGWLSLFGRSGANHHADAVSGGTSEELA